MKKIFLITAMIVVILVTLYLNLNINFIDNGNGTINTIGNKELYLIEEYGENITMPHINVKAIIKEIKEEIIILKISHFGRTYLKTEYIFVKNEENFNFNVGEEVFLKFNKLTVNKNILKYGNLELYKKVDISNIIEQAKESDFLYYKNKTLYRIKGKKFNYKNNKYFIINGTDTKEYYENIKDETLLIEEYKSILPIYYNTLNSQETNFKIVIEDYIGEK